MKTLPLNWLLCWKKKNIIQNKSDMNENEVMSWWQWKDKRIKTWFRTSDVTETSDINENDKTSGIDWHVQVIIADWEEKYHEQNWQA